MHYLNEYYKSHTYESVTLKEKRLNFFKHPLRAPLLRIVRTIRGFTVHKKQYLNIRMKPYLNIYTKQYPYIHMKQNSYIHMKPYSYIRTYEIISIHTYETI